MKPMLFLAVAAATASAAPALADNGQRFDHAAQAAAYSNTLPRDQARRCFNGQFISGVSRSGDGMLYVQSTQGAIYRLRPAGPACAALDNAEKLTLRSNGSDIVCSGEAAETIAWTSAGAQRCGVASVHWLNPGERTALATAARR